MPRETSYRISSSILPLVFFTSGFTAIGYQIGWQRLLVMFSGSDVESATIIVAAFMVGLGCGGAFGGRLADRLPPAACLAVFAASELGIAIFGAFSAALYYDVLYQQFGHRSWSLAARAAILLPSVLWPTVLMGASLPLLVRAVTRDISHAARATGMLYTVNTLGGAAGAFATTWWLLPAFGLRGSLQRCAILNAFVVAAVVPLARRVWRQGSAAVETTPVEPTARSTKDLAQPRVDIRFATWAVLYALAGFLALSLEMLWFRLLGVLLKSSAYVFGTLLAQYLTGLGTGAAAASLLLGRVRQPARLFVAMQAAIGVCAGVGVLILLTTLRPTNTWPWLAAYAASPEPLDVQGAVTAIRRFVWGAGVAPREFLTLYVVLPTVLIFPATMLMGASLPVLQKAVQTDFRQVGRRVGALLSANIAGSALGTFATGWAALSWLGAAGTLKALLLVSAVFPLFGMMVLPRDRVRALAAGAPLVAIAILVAILPDAGLLWGRLHGATPRAIVHGEDGSGTSVLKVEPSGFQSRVAVFANGTSQSWIPYGGVHTVIGALPAFMLDQPQTAALIGLGSGDTVFAVAGRPEIAHIQCIEIIKPQLATLKRLSQLYPYRALDTVLTDRRIEHIYGDGRLHIMQANAKYDLIEADALKPASAYSGNLYSDSYFALLRDHLTPDGVAVSWAPTPRVHDTFVTIFPHVLSYGDVVIGGNRPIRFEPDTIRQRLSGAAVQEHFARAGIDILALLEPYLTRPPRVIGPDEDRSPLRDINTDTFPKDEYGLARTASPTGN